LLKIKMAMNAKNHAWLVQYTNIVNAYNVKCARHARILGALALLVAKKEKRCYTKKRFWIAPLFQKRCDYGFYNALLPTLRLEDLRFHNYFRMTVTQMEDLLAIVGPRLQKLYVVREPITAAERLSLTLR